MIDPTIFENPAKLARRAAEGGFVLGAPAPVGSGAPEASRDLALTPGPAPAAPIAPPVPPPLGGLAYKVLQVLRTGLGGLSVPFQVALFLNALAKPAGSEPTGELPTILRATGNDPAKAAYLATYLGPNTRLLQEAAILIFAAPLPDGEKKRLLNEVIATLVPDPSVLLPTVAVRANSPSPGSAGAMDESREKPGDRLNTETQPATSPYFGIDVDVDEENQPRPQILSEILPIFGGTSTAVNVVEATNRIAPGAVPPSINNLENLIFYRLDAIDKVGSLGHLVPHAVFGFMIDPIDAARTEIYAEYGWQNANNTPQLIPKDQQQNLAGPVAELANDAAFAAFIRLAPLAEIEGSFPTKLQPYVRKVLDDMAARTGRPIVETDIIPGTDYYNQVLRLEQAGTLAPSMSRPGTFEWMTSPRALQIMTVYFVNLFKNDERLLDEIKGHFLGAVTFLMQFEAAVDGVLDKPSTAHRILVSPEATRSLYLTAAEGLRTVAQIYNNPPGIVEWAVFYESVVRYGNSGNPQIKAFLKDLQKAGMGDAFSSGALHFPADAGPSFGALSPQAAQGLLDPNNPINWAGDPGAGFGFFDPGAYLERYPDVRAAVEQGLFANAFEHFQRHGWAEGRDPGPDRILGSEGIDVLPDAGVSSDALRDDERRREAERRQAALLGLDIADGAASVLRIAGRHGPAAAIGIGTSAARAGLEGFTPGAVGDLALSVAGSGALGPDAQRIAGYAGAGRTLHAAIANPSLATGLGAVNTLIDFAPLPGGVKDAANLGTALASLVLLPGPAAIFGAVGAIARVVGSDKPGNVTIADSIDVNGDGAPDLIKYLPRSRGYEYIIRSGVENLPLAGFEGQLRAVRGHVDRDGAWNLGQGSSRDRSETRYFLSGNFGFDPVNATSGPGVGRLPASYGGRLGDNDLPPEGIEITREQFEALRAANGGRDLVGLAAGDPALAAFAPFAGRVGEAVFEQRRAGEGVSFFVDLTGDGRPESVTQFMPHAFRESDGHVIVHLDAPIMRGSFPVANMEEASSLARFGLAAMALVASHPDMMDAIGDDVVGALRFLSAHPDDPRGITFDPVQYLVANPDLREAFGTDLLEATRHYIRHGRHENRPMTADPAAIEQFAAQVAQVAQAAQAADASGSAQAPGFDEEWYLADNPDVAAAVAQGHFTSGFDHYLKHGREEGRPALAPIAATASGFDEEGYLSRNPDVAAAVAQGLFTSAAEHYRLHGHAEGRAGAA